MFVLLLRQSPTLVCFQKRCENIVSDARPSFRYMPLLCPLYNFPRVRVPARVAVNRLGNLIPVSRLVSVGFEACVQSQSGSVCWEAAVPGFVACGVNTNTSWIPISLFLCAFSIFRFRLETPEWKHKKFGKSLYT